MKTKHIILIVIMAVIIIAGSYFGYPAYKQYKFNQMEESQILINVLPGKWRLPNQKIDFIEFKKDGFVDVVGYDGHVMSAQWHTRAYSPEIHIFYLGKSGFGLYVNEYSIDNYMYVEALHDLHELQGDWQKIDD